MTDVTTLSICGNQRNETDGPHTILRSVVGSIEWEPDRAIAGGGSVEEEIWDSFVCETTCVSDLLRTFGTDVMAYSYFMCSLGVQSGCG